MAKMINVDELIEFCNTERAMLHAHGNSVACSALRRVVEFAKEYAVEAETDNDWISVTDETATRGTIIIDKCSNMRYLIFYHDKEKRTLHCLAEDFNVAYLGTDWIDSYLIEEKIDIDRLLTDMAGDSDDEP